MIKCEGEFTQQDAYRALAVCLQREVQNLKADRDELLDALAFAHEVWLNNAPQQYVGKRSEVKSLLRKHGRLT